jgi:release factor glutamine methyltransferase
MKTLRDILSLSREYLSSKSVPSPKRESEDLVSMALGVKKIDLFLNLDRPLEEKELDECRSFLKRRGDREPLAYINKSVDFLDCFIEVSPHVLIPRPETEILADLLCQRLQPKEGERFWDLCCGSGCIGIALKKRFPQLSVTLVDISSDALEQAKKNAKYNNVDVQFCQGDLLKPMKGKRAHYVVSNPPYISQADFSSLEPEVKDYEPMLALLANQDGLEFYQRLARDLPHYLHKKGKVFLEIGAAQGALVQELFSKPPWSKPRIEQDWAGHDRFFFVDTE